MKNLHVSVLARLAGAVVLSSSPVLGQSPYRAELEWTVGGLGVSGGSSSSPVIASIKGACDGHPGGSSNCANPNYQERAGAVSQPSSLSGYGLGWSGSGVTAGGSGKASYVFEDVVFTDETNPASVVPVSVALGFTAQGEQGGSSLFGTLHISVAFFDDQGLADQWSTAIHPDGNVPIPVGTTSLALETNTVYELEISARFSGGGNSGIYEYLTGSVVWNDPPFVMGPDFNAVSTQAGIWNNIRTYPIPVVTPAVGTDWPLVAGDPDDKIYFSAGQPGSPGVYVVSGTPTGIPVQFGTFATFDLFPSPFIPVAFTADGNGAHILPLTTTPSLSGFSLGLQAFQYVLGPPDGWYSSNPWLMTFQ